MKPTPSPRIAAMAKVVRAAARAEAALAALRQAEADLLTAEAADRKPQKVARRR